MKITFRFLGTQSLWLCAIALVAVTAFVVTACGDGGGGGGGYTPPVVGGDPPVVETTPQPVTSANVGKLVWIEAGTFTMGSPESEPGRYTNETQHSVTLTKGFYMMDKLVTQQQYEDIMGTNPSYFNGANLPVERVTWYDVIEFCNKASEKDGLQPVYTISGRTPSDGYPITSATVTADWSKNGYRLPTEAQWEYACRAGTTKAFTWGTDTINDTQANYYASYVDPNNTEAGTNLNSTSEVGSYAANAWGLYDMHGNVFEWCWDWYDDYPAAAQTDPTGAASGVRRVERGGSWENIGQTVRSAYRGNGFPYYRVDILGFRLVRP